MKLKRRNDPSVRAFWSWHVTLWMRSTYSQREYAERNGISRTLLQRWWVWIREDRAREERIKIARCRRRRFSTMTSATSHRTSDVSTVSPAAMMEELADRPIARRRRFTDEDKRHLLDLAKQPGSSISDVASRVPVCHLKRRHHAKPSRSAALAGNPPRDQQRGLIKAAKPRSPAVLIVSRVEASGNSVRLNLDRVIGVDTKAATCTPDPRNARAATRPTSHPPSY